MSDIIIALSTADIVEAEYRDFPDWGPPPPDMGADRLPHSLFDTTDVFVCPSDFVADDLVETFGVKREAIRIVPYALSDQWFEIEPRPERGRVLFVGSADRRKGIHYLAMAAERLKSRGKSHAFRVAGNVDDSVRMHPQAASLSFLGRISRDAVRDEFAAADIFVLPTLAEGSATVIYEAMAAGLAVITTRSAGSVIRNGVDGVIVPERDPDALADAIDELVCDRTLRDRLAGAARQRATEFGWDRYARDLIGLVEVATSDTTAAA